MIGIYFSGTGNTKHCIEKLTALLDRTAVVMPLEAPNIIEMIKNNDIIIFGYPIQFSNTPYIVRDFIHKNNVLWKDKKILCVATMGAFSGDGAGCTARLFRKYGAIVLGGVHIIMPDSVCDSKLLKRSAEQNTKIVKHADKKIELMAAKIKHGKYPKDGITPISHLIGLFGQRLWFCKRTAGYTDKLKISDACVGCGLCVSLCPMKNIFVKNGKAIARDKCTMCYRCISHCPEKAITLLGDTVVEQCRYDIYVKR